MPIIEIIEIKHAGQVEADISYRTYAPTLEEAIEKFRKHYECEPGSEVYHHGSGWYFPLEPEQARIARMVTQ